MIEVVGVRFKQGIRTYYFNPNGVKYNKHAEVIVETKNGLEVGNITFENKLVEEDDVVLPLKNVLREVSENDAERLAQNAEREATAKAIFLEKIAEEALRLQLANVHYNFEGTLVVFSYTADNRIDFRELVKKLAQALRVRIEMRQINMREKARLIGGIGPCGYSLCCNTFLHDLHGSTIKMVKNQKLSLVPERISGLCGKLLCCLRYENDVYTELAELLPDVNQEIQTPDGIGKVVYVNALTQKIDVLFTNGKGVPTKKQYHYADLREEILTLIPEENEDVYDDELAALVQEEAEQVKNNAATLQRQAEQNRKSQQRRDSRDNRVRQPHNDRKEKSFHANKEKDGQVKREKETERYNRRQERRQEHRGPQKPLNADTTHQKNVHEGEQQPVQKQQQQGGKRREQREYSRQETRNQKHHNVETQEKRYDKKERRERNDGQHHKNRVQNPDNVNRDGEKQAEHREQKQHRRRRPERRRYQQDKQKNPNSKNTGENNGTTN